MIHLQAHRYICIYYYLISFILILAQNISPMSFSFKQCTATKSTLHNQNLQFRSKWLHTNHPRSLEQRKRQGSCPSEIPIYDRGGFRTKLWVQDQIDPQYTAHTSWEPLTPSQKVYNSEKCPRQNRRGKNRKDEKAALKAVQFSTILSHGFRHVGWSSNLPE